jgi:hypothetical protein
MIRPSTEQYKKTLKTMPIAVVVLAVIIVVRGGGLLGVALVAIAYGVGVGLGLLYIHRAQLVVTPDELVRIGLVGRRGWPRTTIATSAAARLRASSWIDTRVFLNFFLLDGHGRKILRLRNTYWADADLSRLAEVLGLPLDDAVEVVPVKQFSARYPGVIPFVERRPGLSTLLIFVALLALTVLIGVAVG